MQKKWFLRRLTGLLLIVCLTLAALLPVNAKADSIQNTMASRYSQALSISGRSSFYKYCSMAVRYQLIAHGIFASDPGGLGAGKNAASWFSGKTTTSGGYNITYTAGSGGYNALNSASSNGSKNGFYVVSYTSKSDDTNGHVQLVYLSNGNVYFCDSYTYNGQPEGYCHVFNYSTFCSRMAVYYPSVTGVAYLSNGSPVPTNSDPIGVLDSITASNHTITIRGWAFDPDTPSQSIVIHVYIGRTPSADNLVPDAQFTANTSRPDVNNAYGISGNHGFSLTIPTLLSGSQTVHLYAINTSSGNNPEFAAQTVTIGTALGTPENAEQLDVLGNGCDWSIRPALAPQMSLTVEGGSSAENTRIILEPWSNLQYQTVNLSRLSSGNAYRHIITANHSNSVYDLNCGYKNFGNLLQHSRNDGYNQMWYFVSLGDNLYKIVNVLTGECIDLPNFATATGTVVNMCPDNGSNAQKFYLVPLDLSLAEISVASQVTYTGSAQKPTVTVTAGGVELTQDVDYTLTYVNNTNVGTATVMVVGKGCFKGSKNATFEIVYDGYIAKGVWGTCPWELDTSGLLTVHPGTGASQEGKTTSPWDSYRESITAVAFVSENGKKVVAPADSRYLFWLFENVESMDLSGIDTSQVTCMRNMFYGCGANSRALSILDLSYFDTSKVTDMYGMFTGCNYLTALDVTSFDTSNVTNMAGMFLNCSSLSTLNLSGFETTNVTTMSSMFEGCRALASLDLSGFETSNVTRMTCMFSYCVSLTTLDLSAFDTSSVTTMDCMFEWCSSLSSLNLSGFDTSSATRMAGMFQRCTSLSELDISNFDTAAVTYAGSMFSNCKELNHIAVGVGITSIVLSQIPDYEVYGHSDWWSVSGMAWLTPGEIAESRAGIADTYQKEATTISIAGAVVTADYQMYTGEQLTPSVAVKVGNTPLVADTDFTVTFSNNVNAGVAFITVTGKGNYSGTATGTFLITPADISGAILSADNQIYTGSALTPAVTVRLDSKVLSVDTDYAVTYSENTDTGVATITAVGDGNYAGTATGTFAILPASISGAVVTAADQTYTGSALAPSVTVNLNGKILSPDRDYVVTYSNNIAVGTATITVEGKGNFTGTTTGTFQISEAPKTNISSAAVSAANQTYSGSALTPAVTVQLGNKTLVPGIDFVATYSNNISVGIATITVIGKGDYTGAAQGTFYISSASLSGAAVYADNQVYAGYELTPAVTVILGGKTLVADVDFSVMYSNNTEVGTATIIITGKGNYTGNATGSFEITAPPKIDITGAAVMAANQSYTGSAVTPAVTVQLGNMVLDANLDYTVAYSNNVNIGIATITVTGKGDYTGTASGTFYISPASVTNALVAAPDQTYTGSALKPAVTVNLNGKTLVSGTDYTIAYSNNTEVGTATIVVTGKGNFTGTATGTFNISPASIVGASVTAANQTYTGSALEPTVTVKLNGKTLSLGTDYTVAYSNNTEVGTATITVTGKGNYTGSATGTFQITSATHTPGWDKDADGDWVYYDENGTMLTNQWFKDGGAWYHFDFDGKMETNAWVVDGLYTYYVDKDGKMIVQNWLESSDGAWYYFNQWGEMVTEDWVQYKNSWYYFDARGVMVESDWVRYKNAWYYMDADGAMVANNWVKWNNKWYYMNGSGNPVVNNWVKYNNNWYYMNGSGNPVYNTWITYNGARYHFNSSGVCDRKA